MATPATTDLLTLTTQIVAAHVAGSKVAPDEVPALINAVYGALVSTSTPRAQVKVAQPQGPAVPIKRSIQHEYLVCLEDGAKMKVLTRYLARFGLTPDTYRAKWGLPKDYPMVAPAYAAHRSALAKQFGLGTASRTAEQSAPETPRLPVEVEEPTVPTPGPEHTVASVFARFPGGEPADAAPAAEVPEKPGRKRFAQQSMRVGAEEVSHVAHVAGPSSRRRSRRGRLLE